MQSVEMTSEQSARLAADAALSRKALDVTILDLRELAAFTDFFVICSGTSDTHAQGVAEIIAEKMKEAGQWLWRREGERRADWTLLDYVDVVVHVFTAEARGYFGLERLWADAPSTLVDDEGVEVDPDWEDFEEEDDAPFTARDMI